MKFFNHGSEAKLSPCRRNIFVFSALLIIILSIYSNTFDASWQFDDESNITHRGAVHLRNFTWPEIKRTFFFCEEEMGPLSMGSLYRPVANFTFALNYYFGGLNVFGYHLVNVSVHIMASMFLFLFIYHTLNLPLLRPRYGQESYFIALLATVFWAVNPVQTQAVTYIVQRMASMSAMFFIMAMYFFLKARISQNRARKGLCFSMCFFWGLLAVGTKENAVMLPICIFIFDLFFIQGLTKENLKKNALILFSLIILLLIFALILKGPLVFDLNHILKQYELRPFTLFERLLTEPRILLYYLSLLLYPMPHRLSICPDMLTSHSLIDPLTTIIAILVILGVLGLCIIKSRQWPFIAYCIIFFFLNHIIEGSIFGLELIFEHRNYLPSMLLFAPLAILLVKGINYFSSRRAMQVFLSVFIILVLVEFGHCTFIRNKIWKTPVSLWADAVNKAPGLTRPHIYIGNFLLTDDKLEKAQRAFTVAASSRVMCNISDRRIALYNLAIVHQRKGNLDLALEYYRKSEALSYFPHVDAHNNMAMILNIKGQKKEAKQAYLQALQCGGQEVNPYKNLALMMFDDGHVEEALGYLGLALKRWPYHVDILGLAGYAQRFRGSYWKAFLLLETALAIESHDAKLHLYMSEIYFKRGRDKEAKKQITQFLEREKAGDLSIYIKGIANEDNNDLIKPFKKRVMSELAQAYEKEAVNRMAKVRSLNGDIASVLKRLGGDRSLSPMELQQEVTGKMEKMEVMDNTRIAPGAR